MRQRHDQTGARPSRYAPTGVPPVGAGATSRLIAVADAAALAAWVARSYDEPVVLFNYDPRCGGNERAYGIACGLGRDVVLVDVHAFHRLGAWVADQTGVRHESPQVLVLRDGQAVWHASHGRITAEAVTAARAAGGGRAGVPGNGA